MKNKRESSLFKRRNVPSDTEPDEEEDSEVSVLSDLLMKEW